MQEPMTWPKRWYLYHNKLYLTWHWAYEKYFNTHFKEDWHCINEHAIFIGFNAAWWELRDDRYDGHTCWSVTVLGLIIGSIFTYDARKFSEEPVHDHPPTA